METMCQDFLERMNRPADGLTLEEVKARNEVHGKLTSCSYNASSQGMAFNSNTLLSISVSEAGDPHRIIYVSKECMQPTVTTIYRTSEDILAKIQELAERENLTAWSVLKYNNPFPCTDYSSSASISLNFDDTSVGGHAGVYVSIDVSAACQHGGGDVVKEFRNILESAAENAEVISRKESASPSMVMGLGMGMIYNGSSDTTDQTSEKSPAASHASDDTWKCAECGAEMTGVKFCTQCGAKHVIPEPEKATPSPDGTWTYPLCKTSGNTGKFCFECGAKGE